MRTVTHLSARRNWGRLALAAAAAGLLLVSACGGADTTGSAGADTPAAAEGALADFEAKVDQIVAERSAEITDPPPAEGPKAAPGKKVYVVACIMAAEGCARESRTAMEAGEAVGWDMTLVDTGSLPDKMNAAVQQAIDDGADGLIVQAIDMKTLAAPLAKAKAAGIKIVCFACVNHDDIADQTIPSEESFFEDGYALGAAMYEATDGRPRLIVMKDESFGVVGIRHEGTVKFFEDCKAAGGDCEIVETLDFLVTELTTRVPQLAGGAVRQHPDANAIWMPYDSAGSFITQGLRQVGVQPGKVGLYGFDGNEANITAIRNGEYQLASMAGPFEWVGYAQVDALNRLFNGEDPVDDVVKIRLITPDSLPENDAWSGDIDFKPGYRSVWGIA